MKCVIAIILDTPKIIDRASPRKTAARPSNLIFEENSAEIDNNEKTNQYNSIPLAPPLS